MITAELKGQFQERWTKYFPGAELPIIFYYTDENNHGEPVAKTDEWRCVICDLGQVRKGRSIYFDVEAIGCGGARQYFGFLHERSPDFEYFLSYGIAGKVEGIRYKKSPGLVREYIKSHPPFEAPGRYIVFKRWDMLGQEDQPLGVVFFVAPDALSGLFGLANFDEVTPHGVIAPSCAGCASIVYYPYLESQSDKPRAILGMFDTSARPCVPPDILTFSVPFSKFANMVGNMDESNLITDSWGKILQRSKALK